jgi:CheY-like chemotaxis protein
MRRTCATALRVRAHDDRIANVDETTHHGAHQRAQGGHMPTRRAVTLVDALAEDATIAAKASSDDALRAQAAYVRALADEAERLHPSDSRIVGVHAQLGDELERLAGLVKSRTKQGDGGGEDAPIDVLVVEDDEATRHVTENVLRTLGYPCRTAGSAEDALALYASEPAAIVLSDWNLPAMSGLDLCVSLKQRDPQPYVILATAYHEKERQLDGMRGGADDFLRKPTDMLELEERLRAASRLIRALRAVAHLRERVVATASGA